ncbi:MAG: 2-C-methyl-D-erythritol 2,4-cyclodiphosphate synthase [Phycisphaerae bacterium]
MYRTGLGYDSHRFAENRTLILCGMEVPSDVGLAGHSDADVALHAVTDAILGALGKGDIGRHFPDTDPQWKDADSTQFVRYAIDLAAEQGMRLGNCDLTLLLERPKLKPYKKAMLDRLAEILQVAPSRVAVKAKTNEGMGFVGRREGIAALATVLLESAGA